MLKLTLIAAIGAIGATLSAPQDAAARPLAEAQVMDPSPLARSDLDRESAARQAPRRAPQPSAALKQREIVARALALEFQAWARISNSYDPGVYAAYVARYPKGLFAPLARARAAFLLERMEYEQSLLGMR